MNFLLHVIITVFVISVSVLILWGVSIITGRKAGYHWRKVLWLVMSVYLLISIPVDMGSVTKSLTGLNVDIKLDLPQAFQSNNVSTMNLRKITLNENKTSNTSEVNAVKTKGLSESSVSNTVKENKSGTSEIKQKAVVQKTNNNVQPGVVSTTTSNAEQSILAFIPVIIAMSWIVAIIVFLIIRVLQYRKLRSRYNDISYVPTDAELLNEFSKVCSELNIKKSINIRMINKESGITSPMLFGYRKTILLLPNVYYTTEELDVIFRHELAHYQAGDLWYKLLIVLTCDIYWFNPIFKLMKKMAFQDVEFVCDERVTKYMDNNKKKTYCSTILKTMSGRNKDLAFSAGFAMNKKKAKERFENIFSAHNRRSAIALLMTCVMTMTFTSGCVSLSVTSKGEDNTKKVVKITDDNNICMDASCWMLNQGVFDKWVMDTKEFNITKNKRRFDSISEDNYEELKKYDCYTTSYGTTAFSKLVEMGEVADITSILEKRGWLSEMSDSMRTVVSDADGNVYGIPLANSSTIMGLAINKTIFEEAGLVENNQVKVPETWEELAEFSRQVKEKTGKAGFVIATTESSNGAVSYESIAMNFGAELISKDLDGNVTLRLDSEEAIEAMKFIKDLAWKDKSLKGSHQNEGDTNYPSTLSSGGAAMSVMSNYEFTERAKTNKNIVFVPLPAGPTGEQYICGTGAMIVFSSHTSEEKIDAILSLIEKLGYGPKFGEEVKTDIDERDNRNGFIRLQCPDIPTWKDKQIRDYQKEVLNKQYNIDPSQYEGFIESSINSSNIKNMWAVGMDEIHVVRDHIINVIDKVVNDENADVEELMEEANEECQKEIEAFAYVEE